MKKIIVKWTYKNSSNEHENSSNEIVQMKKNSSNEHKNSSNEIVQMKKKLK